MFTVKVAVQRRPQSAAIADTSSAQLPTRDLEAMEPLTTDEVVFEATQVRMVRDGRLVSVDLGDGSGSQEVRSVGERNTEPVGHIYCDTETGQIVYDIAAVAKSDTDIIMYVMNRNGATVAKYYL